MQSDIIRKIEDLIEGIDEFNEKYVTYNAKVLRIVLVETIDYIKQKERALDEIKDYCNKYPQNSIGFKKYILQKISEYEVENDN